MVHIPIIVEGKETLMYIDGQLNEQIDKKVIPNIKKRDMDGVYIVDGEEGSGKSVFTMQLGKKLDPNLRIENICFSPEKFTKAIVNAKKGDCIIFDEAFTGLSSRGSLTEINRLLVGLMMEMRQKNLFVLIVMPSFFLLDKYVALWRARGLFHVYTRNGKRGYWIFFNRRDKKLLYLKGKNVYDYSYPKPKMRGRFLDKYVIDETTYRGMKRDAMQRKSRISRAHLFLEQRNTLLHILSKKFGLTNTEISNMCNEFAFKIARNTISEILIAEEKKLANNSK